MPTSRYNGFRKVKSYTNDPLRLETFPPIDKSILENIPHTIIKFKETDRLDHLAETFLGNSTYWWAICLMNNLNNPFSYKLLPGVLLKIPNTIEQVLMLIKQRRNG